MNRQDLFKPDHALEGAGRRKRRRIRTSGALALALLIAAGAGWYFAAVPLFRPCNGDLTLHGGECVGVSDGTHSFGDNRLASLEARIRDENRKIAGSRAITVALLMPITLQPEGNPRRPGNNLLSLEQVRAQIEGAHIAQLQANNSEQELKVRLVLANEGSHEHAWRPVVDRLKQMVHDPQPLVAVTGLGVSVQQTVDGARELSRSGIPMVGAVITADGLNSEDARIPGLTRVNPSNSDVLAALAGYLPTQRPDLRTAMLVADTNPDDFYTRNLTEDFQRQLGSYLRAAGSPTMPYQGRPGSVGITTQFENIAGRLCGDNPPDMVFYAGRAGLLPEFVTQLRQRGCARDRNVTVVTGSDASDLQVTLDPPARTDAPVSVIYGALAEPTALADPATNPDFHGYQRFEEAFLGVGFPAEHLSNGWAIMQHDALLAVETAARNAVEQQPTLPEPGDVGSHLLLFNDATHKVNGAGGSFNLDLAGNATNRRIPIIELTPEGNIKVLDVP